jgi:hypothetical protein
MNPKSGWVRNMVNIFNMIERVNFLDEIRETERKKAAEQLQKEVCAFVAHYGQVSTDECPSTWHLYVLLCNGNVLIRKDDEDDNMEEFKIENLSLVEMEFIREYMVDTLNRDSQYIDDEIERYIDLYL